LRPIFESTTAIY
jgi:acetyl esterase/lipase